MRHNPSIIRKLLLFVALMGAQWQVLAQPVPVVSLVGQIWRHASNNLDGVNWMAPDYDDSGAPWFEGPSLLSNDTGNGGINPLIRTPIAGPQSAVDGVVQHAYYFRTRFNWNSAPVPSVLSCTGRVDDGAIFFLNGNEIFRLRVAADTAIQFAALDFATGLACGGDADCDDLFTMPATGLVEGENVLSAIVYQEGGNSSDITFGISAEIIPAVAPTILVPTQPADRIVPQNQTLTLTVVASGFPVPNFQWFKDGTEITGATG
jgi:hypothetical protein